jgi:glycosyltransferase involved in cell wall biosynthesis
VLQKNLLVGFLLKWFFKIPYVISEQSTLYIDGRFEMMNFFERQMYKWVFLCASSTHAVSNYLLRSIRQKLKKKFAAVVIPNVVNVDLFCYSTRNLNGVTTFVHVSNMVYQKNVEGMLHAFKKAKVCNNKFLLHLVGPLPSHIPHLIEQLNLSEYVILWNERSYTEVAEIMKQSDVFIFFTRFETFGCVIIEANACGLPVIATDFEVTRELITDGVNGLLVENENVDELALKISEAIVSIDMFDRKAISAQTKEQFNYEVIANKFLGWYNDVLREA